MYIYIHICTTSILVCIFLLYLYMHKYIHIYIYISLVHLYVCSSYNSRYACANTYIYTCIYIHSSVVYQHTHFFYISRHAQSSYTCHPMSTPESHQIRGDPCIQLSGVEPTFFCRASPVTDNVYRLHRVSLRAYLVDVRPNPSATD